MPVVIVNINRQSNGAMILFDKIGKLYQAICRKALKKFFELFV